LYGWKTLQKQAFKNDNHVNSLSKHSSKASSKNKPNSRQECKNHTLFETRMAKINTLLVFLNKMAKANVKCCTSYEPNLMAVWADSNNTKNACFGQASNLI